MNSIYSSMVINADDFGMSPEINSAIVQAFELGLISSATLLTNMPGFIDASSYLQDLNLVGRIGVHLNFVEGRPLTAGMTKLKRFCNDNGRYHGLRPTAFHLNRVEAGAVEEEIRAQIEAVVALGITPSHIDSHHHAHTEWAIGRLVTKVAIDLSIPAVRLTRNCGAGMSLAKRVYKRAFNHRLKNLNLALTSIFGSASDFSTIAPRRAGPIEIEVHPQFALAGALIDATGEHHKRLEAVISPLLQSYNLVSYADLAHARDSTMADLPPSHANASNAQCDRPTVKPQDAN
jgi:predicted glycoside hydrolase/deacetylase ChbG (UPF0249 family)